ncbi:MAG: glycosyltransferase family 2 protein [Cyanobacteria bacterium J06576_12]
MTVSTQPLVSVIITTLRRPHLVLKAIDSVLSQTLKNIELIVVVDGPDDPQTVEVLQKVEDPRFRFVVLPRNVKLAQARNEGVKEAKADWVAFLDDDDVWMPEKLEAQLAVGTQSKYEWPIVASRFVAETAKGKFVWPKRLPRPDEPIGDYIFIRNSFFQGEGVVLPTTFFVRRELLERIPFVHGKHEDYDWLLRVGQLEGTGLAFVAEPMAVWHFHEGTGLQRLSQNENWKQSLAWIRAAKPMMSRQAYSGFIVHLVSPAAAAARDWSAFGKLLREFVVVGRARPFDYLLFASMWFIPGDLRRQIRWVLNRRKRTASTAMTP